MTRLRTKLGGRRKPTFTLTLAAVGMAFGLNASYAQSSETPIEAHQPVAAETTQPIGPPVTPNLSKPYYIEFRSRSAQSYGHTFSIYGRMNGGRIASKTVAGLHPFTESAVPWMIGHLVLVPSETGASDGDTEDQYVTARFRVGLTQDEYRKVAGFIKQLQRSSPVWHAVFYNCNGFVGDIAKFMGMETPSSTMLMPADYITGLRDLNISRRTAGMIGTPVKVEDAAKLRAESLKALKRREKPAESANTSSKPGTT